MKPLSGWLAVLALTACAPFQSPPPPTEQQTPSRSQTISALPSATAEGAPSATLDIAASSTPTGAPREESARTSANALKATAAMPMDGKLDSEILLAQVNGQLGPLVRCVALIRRTDKVVGSLNLQVTIASDGAVKPDLQSPMNKEAEACLLDGMKNWKLAGQGAGRAMVLLSLNDK
jgi:hypothetical protein